MSRFSAASLRYGVRAMLRSPGSVTDSLTNPWHAVEVLHERFTPAERHLIGAGLLADAQVDIRAERNGTVFFLQPSLDTIVNEVIETGSYSEVEMTLVSQWLATRRGTSDGLLLNLGANIGTTAIWFASRGWRVIAVEPAPDALRLLRENVEVNDLTVRIDIVEGAITAHETRVDLAMGSNLSTSQLLLGRGIAEVATTADYLVKSINVRGLSVPTVLRESAFTSTDVSLVWSDTEGSEADVIVGGEAIWAGGAPLWVEICPYALEARGALADFAALVRAHFTAFYTEADLRSDQTEPRLIDGFATYLSTLGRGRWDFANVLLTRDA